MITTKEYIELDKKCPWYCDYEGNEKDKELIIEYNKALIEKYPFLIPRNLWTDKVVEDYDYHYTLMDNMPFGWRIAFGDQMLEELREELIKFNYLDKFRIEEIKEKYGHLCFYYSATPVGTLSEDYEPVDAGLFGPPLDYIHGKEFIKEISRENYYPIEDFERDFGSPEWREKNKDCIIHYGKFRIIDKCKVDEIVSKYEEMSVHTCIDCGAQNTPMYESKGWINFVCKDCAEKRLSKTNTNQKSNYKLEDFYYLPGENK